MQQIGQQFDNQRELADQIARREQLKARIRKGISLLVLFGLLGTAYAKRAGIQTFITTKLTPPAAGAPAKPESAASSAVAKAQENASTRDQLIDSLAK